MIRSFSTLSRGVISFMILAINCISLTAQTLPPGQYTSSSKKAIKLYEEGRRAYENHDDQTAEKAFLKALSTDEQFIEVALSLGTMYFYNNKPQEAEKYFSKAISINPKFYANAYYYLASAQLLSAKYEEAKGTLKTFLQFERIAPALKEDAQRLMKNAEFGADAIKHPKPFKLVNAGSAINTELNEYFPAISGDGLEFLFTRALIEKIDVGGQWIDKQNEDFFMSTKVNGEWQRAVPISAINSVGNEGAPALSADGNIMFFASCADEFGDYGARDRKGYGSCDIFYSQKINGVWTAPRNAGPAVNTSNWETQPSFSSDGKTLYFIRGTARAGRIKEQDIYSSTLGDDGRFMPAVKLSTVINTPLKEESVFIHPDNQTLYFSSDGHPGMGALDIFVSRRQLNGEWGTPENLGYPINTVSDENSVLVDPSGNLAYFASDRTGGMGGLDIYYFDLPKESQPEKITYVKGKVIHAVNKSPLEANVELYDLATQKLVTQVTSQRNGDFFITLNSNHDYLVNVNKERFLFYSENFSLKDKVADFNHPYLLSIPLVPVDTGYVVELKNVFFDVNKWDLKPESRTELEKLVSLLQKNPTLKIEISGHTDNTGDKKANLLLSENRAKAVYEYLIKNGGIAASRLSYKGYGETRPKVPNTTPENKAANRRTEFKVTGK